MNEIAFLLLLRDGGEGYMLQDDADGEALGACADDDVDGRW